MTSFMLRASQFCIAHVRTGYVVGLLAIDALLLALIAFDVTSVWARGRSAIAFLDVLQWDTWYASWKAVLVFGVTLIVFVPVSVAVVRVIAGPARKWGRHLEYRDGWVVVMHVALSVLMCCMIVVEMRMRALVGMQIRNGSVEYAYTPAFLWAASSGLFSVAAVVCAVLTPFLGVLLRTASAGEQPRWFPRYRALLALADSQGDLQPLVRRAGLNFNSAAVAPELRCVRRAVRKTLDEYQRSIPGSQKAELYLTRLSEHARDLVREVAMNGVEQDCRIEFFCGTSRALEVAIARVSAPRLVVLSPYEHPSEVAVVKWLEELGVCDAFVAKTFSAHSAVGSDSEVDAFVNDLGAHLAAKRPTPTVDESTPRAGRGKGQQRKPAITQPAGEHDGDVIMVISDVCYATGVPVPAGAIYKKARKVCKGRIGPLIVDGAHSAGNLRWADLNAPWMAYVMSAHKWLLSPEPCGILISKDKETDVPYDAWGDSLPKTTASVRMLAGLCAGLETIKRNKGARFEYNLFWDRSRALRDELINRVDKCFTIHGQIPGDLETLMVTLSPSPGYTWKVEEAHLDAHFALNHANVFIVAVDNVQCIRLSFPFYLSYGDVIRMADLLLAAVRVKVDTPELH